MLRAALRRRWLPFLRLHNVRCLRLKVRLRGAIEARVLNGMALTIRQKGLETNINADVRMLTRELEHARYVVRSHTR